jgi:ATP synthase protein I
MLRRLSKPIRVVSTWQLAATAGIALAAGAAAGRHGAISAAAGGLISVCAGLVAATVASRSAKSAGGVLVGALAAEAVKIALAVVLLLAVIAAYDRVVIAALAGGFVVTMLIFSMAFFVREH